MDNRSFDVAALGELLIDFTQSGVSAQGNPLFEANPGGAPANVLAMLCRLGRRCAFLGKVGADGFGDRLAAVLGAAGIDLRGLRRDPEIPTTLAIVRTLPGIIRPDDKSMHRNLCRIQSERQPPCYEFRVFSLIQLCGAPPAAGGSCTPDSSASPRYRSR